MISKIKELARKKLRNTGWGQAVLENRSHRKELMDIMREYTEALQNVDRYVLIGDEDTCKLVEKYLAKHRIKNQIIACLAQKRFFIYQALKNSSMLFYLVYTLLQR